MGVYAVAVDGSSNVVAGGTFASVVTFPRYSPGGQTSTGSGSLNASAADNQDAWVAQLSSDGFLKWAFPVGGSGVDGVIGVGTVPTTGDVYAAAYIGGVGQTVFGIPSTTPPNSRYNVSAGNTYTLAHTNKLTAAVATWPVDTTTITGDGNVDTITHTNAGSAEFYEVIAH